MIFPKHSPVCRPARENFFPSEKAGPLSATHPLYFLRVKRGPVSEDEPLSGPAFSARKKFSRAGLQTGYAWGKSYAIIKTEHALRRGEVVAVSIEVTGETRLSPTAG